MLAAVNAKYIHSNLAVYSLKAYADARLRQSKSPVSSAGHAAGEVEIEIGEYTINQQPDRIMEDIYKRRPDLLCFSCYIWNIQMIRSLLPELGKVLPDTEIWLGGPEVSYDPVRLLEQFPQVTGIMKGEGEETFAVLAGALAARDAGPGTDLEDAEGITWRDSRGQIRDNPWRQPLDMDQIPFVYQDMTDFRHRIVYYESSRGCPFSCSYCLSSVDKRLRFRSLSLVKRELQFFLDAGTEQVKFVDRTFNCRHDHALEIWKYIRRHDNGITNFHFEVSADLLNEEELELIRSMRPGLIQLEIGVQSTNPETIREIRRTMDLARLEENVRNVREGRNVHQHLDLIAGLPWEDLESFGRSFDRVYALRPDQLQLGFLKILKGSRMEKMKEAYGLLCRDTPPYEVLSTRWLSYGDVLILKGVEEMTELYYNSGQFRTALELLELREPSPFALYRRLAAFYEREGLDQVQHARAARYEILLDFVRENWPEDAGEMRERLIFDYYLRENAKSRPAFAGESRADGQWVRGFYETEAREHRFLEDCEGADKNQLRRMTHLEYFPLKGEYVLFDYRHRDPLTNDGRGIHIAIEK